MPPAHSRHRAAHAYARNRAKRAPGHMAPGCARSAPAGTGKLAPDSHRTRSPSRRPWSRPPVALEGHCHYHGGAGPHATAHRPVPAAAGRSWRWASELRPKKEALPRRARPRAMSSPGRCGTRSRICTIFRTSRQRRWPTRCHPTGALQDQTPRVGRGPRSPPARGRRCSGACSRRSPCCGPRRSIPPRPLARRQARHIARARLAGALRLAARRQEPRELPWPPWPPWAPAGATGC